ncbi:metallophosphoesterase family protein [Serpentinimonas barnesii]|uniref:metallophosphoesterase family protein n=1 Tax=Serpentinimonas barnesii TaxID=1458427 RepID=UPI0004980535|nr:metallophosphoesterase [Serpentinimonas barnesii]
MSLVLQVSDTHFGTEQPPVVEALVQLAQQQHPDLLLLSGDITQRARPAQFRAARAFMERLAACRTWGVESENRPQRDQFAPGSPPHSPAMGPEDGAKWAAAVDLQPTLPKSDRLPSAPWLAVPGNHDIALFDLWTRLRRPYAQHLAAFGPELEPIHDSPELLVLCLNTTRPWRHKHGEVSAAQIERVAQRLEAASAAQLRVVVVHQPVAVIRASDVVNRLRGHEAALPRWAAAGADLVLGGHIHLPYVRAVPGLARPLWAVQAGTAVSARLREGLPNSVNLLRWGAPHASPGCCLIEQWDYAAAQRAFVRALVTEVWPARA